MEKKTFKRYDRENVMLTGCERKHAYLIMAHKDDYTFRTLLPMLDDPRNDIFIHMDVKSRQFDRNDVIDSLSYSKCFFTRRTNVDLRISDQGKRLFEEKPQERVFRTPDEVKAEFFPRLLASAPAKKDAFRSSVWNEIYSMNIIRKYGIRFPSEREYLSEDVMFNIDYYQ